MSRHLLIVDDEPMIGEIIKMRLQSVFDEVFVAPNGKVALEIVEAQPHIKLVICDIRMPVMSGVEFLKTMRQRGFEQPLIVFTAFADRALIDEVNGLGVCGFFEKTQLEGLFEAVLSGIAEQPKPLDLAAELARLDDLGDE